MNLLGNFSHCHGKRLLKFLSGWALLMGLVVLPVDAQIHDPLALKADPASADQPIAPLLTGLGDHHFPVTTSVARSQTYFDQGLRLTLGFNHSEALRSFKEAARLDPENAMAYWGMALVLGPNLNLPMQASVVPQAYDAIQQALALKQRVSAREQAYIDALAVRYSPTPEADRAPLDRDYASAMKRVMERFPDDPDAATLYVAAVMNTNPWDYWYRDGTPKPGTEAILSTLQAVLKDNPNHPGALHYMIHLVEAFRPELGVDSADRLGTLMPGAGHLVHMPAHIYMRVGRYGDSYNANVKAILADEGYITQCRAQGLYPLGYYPHNIHFLAWSAMFQGRSKEALSAARKVAGKIPDYLQENTWGLNETFISQPMFVMVRFGLWDDMLNEPQPPAGARFLNGIWHYGRGMARVHNNQIHQSKKELKALQRLQNEVTHDENYYVGFGAASTLLNIAKEVLAGEIEAKQKNYDTAIAHLSRAVRLEDGLMYNEPPDWYFPVRHILGAVLLDAQHPAEAEVVYWEDLRRNPMNGYSLFGLQLALKAQNKTSVHKEIEQRFQQAWQQADVTLSSSRF
ncbi:hypothetical protein G8770_19635 [Aestuariicella hydrocarbonica]|uniref:Tetratricopeptide repeat protein n=1 Tax=Pseudomaricurvus hydrocarbonicus TaxID=1470433 RepID=A0A9E5MNX1_9GAMM|nr:hypothetical protein [Aestuariicella hydrocarbonica]NHO67764.1 hypothetical protein [Aestuariicella hydrocarbonica]